MSGYGFIWNLKRPSRLGKLELADTRQRVLVSLGQGRDPTSTMGITEKFVVIIEVEDEPRPVENGVDIYTRCSCARNDSTASDESF